MHILITLFFPILLYCQVVNSWPPIFGFEFIFTNEELVSIESKRGSTGFILEKRAAILLKNEIKKKCEAFGCKIELAEAKHSGLKEEFRVIFNDGYYFQISWDPKVVEVIGQPLTRDQLWKNEKLFQELLFDTANSIGLKSNKHFSGHFNIGIESSFNKSVELFLKYFVDYSNRPELANKLFGFSLRNAPTLSWLKESQREALEKVLINFKNGAYSSIDEAAHDIQTKVYTQTYKIDRPGASGHFQALSIKSIAGLWDTLTDPLYELVPPEPCPVSNYVKNADQSISGVSRFTL